MNLRTWGTCPFVIDRMIRVNAATLRVVGREGVGCSAESRRFTTSARLTKVHAVGGQGVTRVVVVSTDPSYRREASVPSVIS